MNATPLSVQNFNPVLSVLRTHQWRSLPNQKGQTAWNDCKPSSQDCALLANSNRQTGWLAKSPTCMRKIAYHTWSSTVVQAKNKKYWIHQSKMTSMFRLTLQERWKFVTRKANLRPIFQQILWSGWLWCDVVWPSTSATFLNTACMISGLKRFLMFALKHLLMDIAIFRCNKSFKPIANFSWNWQSSHVTASNLKQMVDHVTRFSSQQCNTQMFCICFNHCQSVVLLSKLLKTLVVGLTTRWW